MSYTFISYILPPSVFLKTALKLSLVKHVLLSFSHIHPEAAVAGGWTEHIDEEGAGHLLALLSDQPINCYSTACLCCTQAFCTKGP